MEISEFQDSFFFEPWKDFPVCCLLSWLHMHFVHRSHCKSDKGELSNRLLQVKAYKRGSLVALSDVKKSFGTDERNRAEDLNASSLLTLSEKLRMISLSGLPTLVKASGGKQEMKCKRPTIKDRLINKMKPKDRLIG